MIVGVARARAALVGKPSDGYGGAVLTTALEMWSAIVELEPGGRDDVVDGPDGLVPIVASARLVARRRLGDIAPARLRVRTSVPREVGLAGSSAVVIATLDATARQAGIVLDRERWPSLALHVETAQLGIPGGLQDRVAQVWGGVVLCDVRADRVATVDGLGQGTYRRLDPDRLPALAVAWLPTAGQSSRVSQAGLRAGDDGPERRAIFADLGALAVETTRRLGRGESEALGPAMAATMAARRRLVPLVAAHADLVDRLASTGAHVNYTGSGGAVVTTLPEGGIRALGAALPPGGRVEPLRVAPERPGLS